MAHVGRRVRVRATIRSAIATLLLLASAVTARASLVSYYPLDGNANDTVGGRDGTVVGATPAPDRFGNPNGSYHFGITDPNTGAYAYIYASADGLPTADRTVAFWFRTDDVSTFPVPVGYGGGVCGTSWLMAINASGSRSFSLSYHCYPLPGSPELISVYCRPPTGRWMHFAATTDSSGTRMFVDGVLLAENATFVNFTTTTGTQLGIGVAPSPGGAVPYTDVNVGYFVGEIDDVRIYDNALSQEEITALADGSIPIACIDHFLLYKMKLTADSPPFDPFAPVTLKDQFGPADYQVVKPKYLGLPVDKNGEGFIDSVTHLMDYQVKPAAGSPKFAKQTDVQITNQCNTIRLEVSKPASILVPSLKSLVEPPAVPDIADHQLDHYLCYKAKSQAKLADGTKLPKFPKGVQVVVGDQFHAQTRRFDLRKITRLCTPVDKSGNPVIASGPNKGQPFPITASPIRHPADPYVCYQAKLAKALIPQTGCGPTTPGDPGTKIVPAQPKQMPVDPVFVNNQFGPGVLVASKEAEFCIPSTSVSPM